MTPIRAVFFDWGETLFSSPDAPAVIIQAAKDRSISVSEPEARKLWREIWAAGKTPTELAKGRDLDPELHRSAWMRLFEPAERVVPGLAAVLYDQVMAPENWIPYADTAGTLRALRRRDVQIGVVSNAPWNLGPIFAAKGLGQFVETFTHSYELRVEKPDQRIFLAACSKHRVHPEETLMVGDNPVTDGGAIHSGMRFHLLAGDVSSGGLRGLDEVVRLVELSAEPGYDPTDAGEP